MQFSTALGALKCLLISARILTCADSAQNNERDDNMESRLYSLSDGKAIIISEHSYAQEDDLQKILADNPCLLLRPGELDNNKLFLVKRELNISEGIDSSNSYSLDILLVDQTGVPVLVEVKRSSDTRIRREVVAQMLDYACRASEWDISTLRDSFQAHNTGSDLETYSTDAFWQQVADNLRSQTLRLVFAADHIPNTLKKLIDFLDSNMPGIEVYGAEIRQFVSDSTTVLSCAILGNDTARSQSKPYSIEWNIDSFSQYLLNQGNGPELSIAEDLRNYATEIGLTCSFGRDVKYPTFAAKHNGVTIFKVVSWENHRDGFRVLVEISVSLLLAHLGPAWSESDLRSLLSQLSSVGQRSVVNRPQIIYIDLELLSDESNLNLFKTYVQKICDGISRKDELLLQ